MSRDGSNIPSREELIARAKALSLKFRERAAATEALRRLTDETGADIRDSGLVRICQPSRYGGFEHSWDVLCEAALELGRGDGSQAWVCTVYAEHAWILGHLPDAAQRDVWQDNPA